MKCAAERGREEWRREIGTAPSASHIPPLVSTYCPRSRSRRGCVVWTTTATVHMCMFVCLLLTKLHGSGQWTRWNRAESISKPVTAVGGEQLPTQEKNWGCILKKKRRTNRHGNIWHFNNILSYQFADIVTYTHICIAVLTTQWYLVDVRGEWPDWFEWNISNLAAHELQKKKNGLSLTPFN